MQIGKKVEGYEGRVVSSHQTPAKCCYILTEGGGDKLLPVKAIVTHILEASLLDDKPLEEIIQKN